jgi:hypothetical protein
MFINFIHYHCRHLNLKIKKNNMDNFQKEDLDFFLPNTFKGLSKEYLIECIFNKKYKRIGFLLREILLGVPVIYLL